MLKTYEMSSTLRMCDCDVSGELRPSALMEMMQEASSAHCDLLSCGRDEMMKRHAIWVLARCEVQMNRYPRLGETVRVMTFPMPVRVRFFPRYFLFTDEHGEQIGKAGTLWLMMDYETRHMLPPGDVRNLMPDNRDLSVPMKLPSIVTQIQGEERVFGYRPEYRDMDMNGHVNNTRYIDWLCNSLGVDVMKHFFPASMVIGYLAEVLPEQQLDLHLIRKDLAYQMVGYRGEQRAFEIGGELRPRKSAK